MEEGNLGLVGVCEGIECKREMAGNNVWNCVVARILPENYCNAQFPVLFKRPHFLPLITISAIGFDNLPLLFY